MPRINNMYIDCSIYLYASKADADAGVRSGGSGFLAGIPAKNIPGAFFFYAVTNAHVIESGGVNVRLNTADGKFDVFELTEATWNFHPDGDDIAVAALGNLERYKVKAVTPEHIFSKDDILKYNIGPGDDVFTVGRFVNAEGRQKNSPTLRMGNIAQMPDEKIPVERAGGVVFQQESFLVEARSISGFSGSPVFAMTPKIYARQGGEQPQQEINLLGICWGYIKDISPVTFPNGKWTDVGFQVEMNTGLMGVVPAWKILDLLMHPKAIEQRERSEDAALASMPKVVGTLTSASAPPANAENPTHREDFTSLLKAASKTPPQDD